MKKCQINNGKKYKTQNQNAGGFHKMNQKILKRLDNAISSTLIGKSKDPDCNVGAAISVIHKGQEVFRNEYGMQIRKRRFEWQRTVFSVVIR